MYPAAFVYHNNIELFVCVLGQTPRNGSFFVWLKWINPHVCIGDLGKRCSQSERLQTSLPTIRVIPLVIRVIFTLNLEKRHLILGPTAVNKCQLSQSSPLRLFALLAVTSR